MDAGFDDGGNGRDLGPVVSRDLGSVDGSVGVDVPPAPPLLLTAEPVGCGCHTADAKKHRADAKKHRANAKKHTEDAEKHIGDAKKTKLGLDGLWALALLGAVGVFGLLRRREAGVL